MLKPRMTYSYGPYLGQAGPILALARQARWFESWHDLRRIAER